MTAFIYEVIKILGCICVFAIAIVVVSSALICIATIIEQVINMGAITGPLERRKKRRATKNLINALKALDKIDGDGLEVVSKLMQAHGAHYGNKERLKRELEEEIIDAELD